MTSLVDQLNAGWYALFAIECMALGKPVVAFLRDESLNAAFLAESEAAGLLALKGHKAVGGMRASLYNAMPMEGVQALIDFLKDFEARHGG